MVTIIINGRLAADPELVEVNGYRITRLNVAARSAKKDAQGNYITNFYRCSCFGALGDTISKNFHKGDGIVLSGALSVRDYVATSGEAKYSLDVEVRDFDFGIGRKQNAENEGTPSQAPRPKRNNEVPVTASVADDDLPF